MIIVKVELWSAITGKITEIGRMRISNEGTSSNPRRGDYKVKLMRRGNGTKVQREGEVKNHARLSKSIWTLVSKALASVGM